MVIKPSIICRSWMTDVADSLRPLHALDLTKGESIDAFVAEVVAQSLRIETVS
jgi:hypothetical protein